MEKTIKQEKELAEFIHKLRMKELEYLRESDRIQHERLLERGRIKSAEIRKNIERTKDIEFMKNYAKSD